MKRHVAFTKSMKIKDCSSLRDHHERPVRESGSFFVPNALTMDIRAVFSSHIDQARLGIPKNAAMTLMARMRQ